jgi:hypothetical protein
MQIAAAMCIACSAMPRASRVVCAASAFAAASAYAPPGSDRHDPIVGLDEIAVARQQIRRLAVHDDEHRLEPAEDAIGAPVLGELDRRSLEVPSILFEFRLESREKRERVGRGAGKPGKDAVVVQPADLPRVLFDDGIAEGDLPVAGHHGLAPVPHRQDGGCVKHVRRAQ